MFAEQIVGFVLCIFEFYGHPTCYLYFTYTIGVFVAPIFDTLKKPPVEFQLDIEDQRRYYAKNIATLIYVSTASVMFLTSFPQNWISKFLFLANFIIVEVAIFVSRSYIDIKKEADLKLNQIDMYIIFGMIGAYCFLWASS